LNHREVYVKRVIGGPGDRIRIANKMVYLDGAPIQEPYRKLSTNYVDAYRDFFPGGAPNVSLPPVTQQMLDTNVVDGEVVVPQGKYFVLGDNRDDSSDSRYWGFVSAAEIIGKPFLIYDSEDKASFDLLPRTPQKRGRVRWNRLFKIL
jgi:signal peptidase I